MTATAVMVVSGYLAPTSANSSGSVFSPFNLRSNYGPFTIQYSIDSRLYDVVLQDGSDDLRQMFSNDPYCLDKIDRMEKLVFSTHNNLKQTVEDFVKTYKHLDRKEFALVVQRNLPKDLNHQGLAFALYNDKPANYKEVMSKYMKDVLANF